MEACCRCRERPYPTVLPVLRSVDLLHTVRTSVRAQQRPTAGDLPQLHEHAAVREARPTEQTEAACAHRRRSTTDRARPALPVADHFPSDEDHEPRDAHQRQADSRPIPADVRERRPEQTGSAADRGGQPNAAAHAAVHDDEEAARLPELLQRGGRTVAASRSHTGERRQSEGVLQETERRLRSSSARLEHRRSGALRSSRPEAAERRLRRLVAAAASTAVSGAASTGRRCVGWYQPPFGHTDGRSLSAQRPTS